MASKASEAKIRASIEREVIRPVFAPHLRKTKDASLPPVILANRRTRAMQRILEALVSRGSAKAPPKLIEEVNDLVRRWAAESFADSFAGVEEFEIRAADERDLVLAEESGDETKLLRILDQRYRERVRKEYGTIELRGVQTNHRVWLDLEQIYVPLRLKRSPLLEEEGGFLPGEESVPAEEALEKHKRLLIVGAPGSGKSTLAGYFATRLAAGTPLPLVVTVRAINSISLTAPGLAKQLEVDERLVRHALEEQTCVLLVDGADEAPERLRAQLTSAIEGLARRHPEVQIVVTSRPAGSPGEVEKSFPGFEAFHLADFGSKDVERFVDKWCLAAETSVRSDRSQAERDARKAAEDLKVRIRKSRSVQRIVVNPLLATIVCVVHRFLGKFVPEHRAVLYEKCTDALLYEWDRAKFHEGAAIGELDARQKRTLLMGVARALHESHEAEIAEKDVIRHFRKTLPAIGKSSLDAKALVTQIRDRSGLLVERRPGFFTFSHLTFQEYLTALDMVARREWAGLASHYDNRWWHEVIALAAGAEGSDAGAIVTKLLAKQDPAAVILAATCLETAIQVPLKLRQRVENEIGKLIPPRDHKTVRMLVNVGDVAAPLLMKTLPTSEGRARSLILLALLDIDYEPAIPAIAACVPDESPSHFRNLTIGEFAATILGVKGSLYSTVARAAIADALQARMVKKALPAGKRRSRPVRSTA
ncbi:MAG: NACHT domain-containing protein [Acidobacteria bacterium]|nr:NACHT domain-containing protein [Acidobacteriota bacterium]